MARATTSAPSPVAPATGERVYASRKVQAGEIFLTANTNRRVPVFREPELCKIFFQELDFYRQQYKFQLHGYVLLPDHFHLLFAFPPNRKFAAFLRDFKSAVGRLVIDWAKENKRDVLLAQLRPRQSPKRRKDPLYCVLQPNSYARPVISPSMFKQKLNYIHSNPVRERLVTNAVDYPYSSLRNYALGQGVIEIDPHDFILD